MDKIIVRDLKIFAYHGVNPEEKQDGQSFYIDITAFADLSQACESDNLDDTVSYSAIIKKATAAFTSASFDLIEKCAGVLAEELLAEFKRIQAVEITVKKPEAPIKSSFGCVAVEIRRER